MTFSRDKQHNLVKAFIYFIHFFWHLNFGLLYFSYNWRNMYSSFLYNKFHSILQIFDFFVHLIIFSQHIIYWNKFIITSIRVKMDIIRTSFSKIRALFLIFNKGQWRSLLCTPELMRQMQKLKHNHSQKRQKQCSNYLKSQHTFLYFSLIK